MKIIPSISIPFLSLGLATISVAETDTPERDAATKRENPNTRVPFESGKNSTSVCENRWSDFLPILGREACELGYVIPRPFGLSIGHMRQDQPFDVGSISVNGINVSSIGLAQVNEVDNREQTNTLRADVWLLPFFNVYGVLGKTEGSAEGPLTVSLDPVFPFLCGLPGNDCDINTTFKLDYTADVYGFGTTIAGGYKDFFGMIDANITQADIDISETDAEALVISSRLGWNGKLGNFAGVLWVGAMYQDIDQTLELHLDAGVDTLIVEIDQSTQEPMNYLIGGQWDINRSFSILTEIGFGKRDSQMLNVTYRF